MHAGGRGSLTRRRKGARKTTKNQKVSCNEEGRNLTQGAEKNNHGECQKLPQLISNSPLQIRGKRANKGAKEKHKNMSFILHDFEFPIPNFAFRGAVNEGARI